MHLLSVRRRPEGVLQPSIAREGLDLEEEGGSTSLGMHCVHGTAWRQRLALASGWQIRVVSLHLVNSMAGSLCRCRTVGVS